jgi:hypothetical protein
MGHVIDGRLIQFPAYDELDKEGLQKEKVYLELELSMTFKELTFRQAQTNFLFRRTDELTAAIDDNTAKIAYIDKEIEARDGKVVVEEEVTKEVV